MVYRCTGGRRCPRQERVERMSVYLRDQRSPFLYHLNFHERSQPASESVDKYYAHLQILYDSCGIDLDMHHNCGREGCDGQVRLTCNSCREDVDIDARFRQRTLRDRLIFGLHDQTMQKEVLKEKLGDLLLACTRDICRSHEGSTQTQDKIQSKDVKEVKKKCGGGGSKGKSGYKKGNEGSGGGTSGDGAGKGGGGGKEPPRGSKTITDCGNCKAKHPAGSCPAKGIKCRRCGKMGHFADWCRAQWKSNNAVFKVASVGDKEPLLELETVINGDVKMVTWLMDTGTQVPLLGRQHLERFGAVKIRPSRDRLAMALNFTSKVLGLVDVTVKAGENSHKTSVYVVIYSKSLVSLGLINEGWPRVCALSLGQARKEVVVSPRAEGDKEVREMFVGE